MEKKRINSHDVARLAGVSQSTVSMILNGRHLPSFTDETIQRVFHAAAELGYHGNRKLQIPSSAGNTILVFCPVLSNPYYSYVVQAIEQAANADGFRTLICTTYRNRDIELRHLAELDTRKVAGIIFTNVPLHIKLAEEINRQTPVVVIGDRDALIDVDTVEVNGYRSGMAIAEHLMELRHRNVAFISTALDNQNIIRVKRMEGVRDALEKSAMDCRLTVKSRSVSSMADIGDPNIEHKIGYELTEECLEDKEITAIIGVNDMVAYGVMDALHDAGYKIPGDYSVCGFDNVFPSHMGKVSMTSIENFMIQKGYNAFDMLCKRIKAGNDQSKASPERITRVEYQPRLIVRSSTGVARAVPTEDNTLDLCRK